MKTMSFVRRLSCASAAALALGIATESSAQTRITDDCFSDDFMPILGNDQVFDLSISLWTTPSAAERAMYEEVLQHFARGVYEMSNGTHKIRNIVIYQEGKRKRFSDIIWSRGISQEEIDASPTDAINDGESAVTHMGGILEEVGKLYIFDYQQSRFGADVGKWRDLVRGTADQRHVEGYILTHEFGHFAYSLGDEYTRAGDEPQVVSVMSHVTDAVQPGFPDNLQWLNFSTSSSINFQRNRGSITQVTVHGLSSWDFLKSLCPRTPQQQATGVFYPDGDTQPHYLTHYPKSVYYKSLSTKAPSTSDTWLNPNDGVTYPTMKPDLVNPATDPLAHFNVSWMDSANVEMELILDASGSMSGTPIQNVIQAAKKFVEQAVMGRTALGVTTFANEPNTTVVPLTRIDSAADMAPIEAKIGAITVGDNTALYAAAKASLEKLQAYRAAQPTQAMQISFLLSDGHDNFSGPVSEQQVIDLYKAGGVRMHTVGYTDRDNSDSFMDPLRRMAAGTGGVFHRGLTEAADINEAMRIAYGDVLTLQDIKIGNLGDPLPIDTIYYQLTFDITYRLNAGGGVSFTVLGPAGTAVPATVVTGSNPDGSATAVVTVNQAAINQVGTGYWRIIPTFAGGGGTIVSQRLQGMPSAAPPIELFVKSKKSDYVYPEPVVFFARVMLDSDITSLNVNAHVTGPAGSTPVIMTDDGSGSDVAAFDGIYTGQLADYTANGVYTLSVDVENLGSALYIKSHGQLASNGAPAEPYYLPVGIPFARNAREVFSIHGISTDDYGNTPAAAAPIAPDGAPHYGRIETAGDVDFFRIDGAIAGQRLSVRVLDQRFGMVPKVTVYASDGSSVISSDNLLLGTTITGYVNVNVPAARAISPLYVKVEDLSGGSGGTYTLNVGVPNAADAMQPAPFITTLPNGDLQLAISFSAAQEYVEVIAERNGAPLASGSIVGTQIDNGDGTYTYVRTIPASSFQLGDQIRARYHSFEPTSPAILTPGPTADVWLPNYIYGATFVCPSPPLGDCGSSLLSPISATSSSNENGSYPASQVIDRDFATRWSSAFNDPQWVMLDLGATKFVHRAILSWEDAASSDYDIQVSDNATTWTTAYTDHAGNGGTDDVVVNASGRYLRIYSRHRTSQWGNSLWEVLLFGDADPACTSRTAPLRSCFPREPVRVGGINFEKWTGISGSSVSNIPTSTPPDYVQSRVTFEGLHNITDNYGVRMRGWVTPPTSGNYTFWVAGDDGVALYLSPSGLALSKALIAHHESFTGFREWNKFASQRSAPVALEKGRWYYIEALMKEASGDDHLSVGWLKPGETGNQPSEVIPGVQLAPYTDSSMPPPVTVGYHTIRNVNSNKCVDVSGASMADGANIQQWQCTSNNGAQQFDLKFKGDGRFWLIDRTSKKCVHVANSSTADGANVEQLTCDGFTSNVWQLVPLGNDQFRAVNQKSGKCLDVAGASTQSGGNIQQANCTSNLAQAFLIQAP